MKAKGDFEKFLQAGSASVQNQQANVTIAQDELKKETIEYGKVVKSVLDKLLAVEEFNTAAAAAEVDGKNGLDKDAMKTHIENEISKKLTDPTTQATANADTVRDLVKKLDKCKSLNGDAWGNDDNKKQLKTLKDLLTIFDAIATANATATGTIDYEAVTTVDVGPVTAM